MTTTETPLWWSDIQRSCDFALLDYVKVLDSLEMVLTQTSDSTLINSRKALNHWLILQDAATAATGRLARSFQLAESRRCDAVAMGFTPPVDHDLSVRSSAASGRFKKLQKRMQQKMKLMEQDLSARQTRRPISNLYRSNTPSYIDVRV